MTQGRLVGLDREAMEIDFPKNSIYFEQIKESEKAELLVNYCKEFFGNTDFQVKIVEAQDTVSKDVAMKKEAAFREEAVNNPVICKALNLFKGSEIVEIKKL